MLMEIQGQKIVSGCKNTFRTFYITVMRYGVWMLIFFRKEQMQMKLVYVKPCYYPTGITNGTLCRRHSSNY